MAAAMFFLIVSPANAVEIPKAAQLRDKICELNKEQWSEFETVDAAAGQKPAYREDHTQCTLEFVSGGRWYKFDFRTTWHHSLSFGWVEQQNTSMSLMALEVDSIDVQNGQPIIRWTLADRKVTGQATFGVRDTFGGIHTFEHLYVPAQHSEDDECAVACEAVGAQYAGQWQRLYDEAIETARYYLETRYGK